MGDSDMVGAVLRDRGIVAFQAGYQKKAMELIEKITLLQISKHIEQLGISQVKYGLVFVGSGDLKRAETPILEGLDNIE